MLRVAIIGATGYTGAELLRLLNRHPKVCLTAVTSEKQVGKPIAQLFPHLYNAPDLICESFDLEILSQKADFFFLALPPTKGMGMVESLINKNKKVVDLSADFRLRDPDHYARWYKIPHEKPSLLKKAVYGLPEIHRDKIKQSNLVANPGCYPTAALLGLAPLLKSLLIDPSSIVIDAKSGVSGAGRNPQLTTLFSEANEALSAYNVLDHRHRPEINQEISGLTGTSVSVPFVPHLIPMTRGILTTIYAKMTTSINSQDLVERFHSFYKTEPFIRILREGSWPNTRNVRGSNVCQIGMTVDQELGRLIVITAIDNLVKGASGQAIQNMNLMMGFEEPLSLDDSALFP